MESVEGQQFSLFSQGNNRFLFAIIASITLVVVGMILYTLLFPPQLLPHLPEPESSSLVSPQRGNASFSGAMDFSTSTTSFRIEPLPLGARVESAMLFRKLSSLLLQTILVLTGN